MKRPLAWIVVVPLLACASGGCREANEYVAPPPPKVDVAQPLSRTVTDYVEFTGTTEAVESVIIRARVSGFLDEVKFDFGQEVERGQPLYTIDPRPFQATLDQANAAVLQAMAEFANSEARYKRAQPLVKSGAVSPEEADERKAEMDVAKAAIVAAEADVRAAELELDYTNIRSPIKGRVGKTLATVGNLVGKNDATHLTTVIKYDPIYANFTISERDLLIFMGERPVESEKATKVFLRRANDAEFLYEGRTDYADLAVDEGTGTYAVRAIFDNPDRSLVPGLFVEVRIPARQMDDAILIDERSIGSDQLGRYVLIVDAENIVQRRSVRLGGETMGLKVVLEGINADDWVVVNGVQRARPGSAVDPQRVELTATSAPDTSGADAPDTAGTDTPDTARTD